MSMNTGWRVERSRRLPVVLLGLVLMAGSAFGGYWFGDHHAKHAAAATPLVIRAVARERVCMGASCRAACDPNG